MRHAVVMAGLALGLMSGTAKAAPITYNVDISEYNSAPYYSFAVGTITTNGTIGVISSSDILSYSLNLGSQGEQDTINFNTDGPAHINVTNVIASESNIIFLNSAFNNSIVFGNLGVSHLEFYSYNNNTTLVEIQAIDRGLDFTTTAPSFVIGTVSPVPLPASASMFGAALMALGAVGYGLKRNKAAAAS